MVLSREASQLLVVDVQERLGQAMSGKDACLAQIVKLCTAAQRLGVPITITEQYPKGIGATVGPIIDAAAKPVVLQKMTFSALRTDAIATRLNALAASGRRQIVVCGIESHVCVLQTALDLQASGFEVFAVSDAMASRQPESKTIAMARLQQAGVVIVNFEMAAFEWLARADTAEFKALLPLIK